MKKYKTVLALLLCFSIVFSYFIFLNGKDNVAEAAMSLPGIEEIKQNSETFNILEIVPEEGSGSIGWYISGQEPGKNWAQDQLASISPKSARETAAEAYLSSLESAGLLGVSGTPLFYSGEYIEYLPWSLQSNMMGLRTLALTNEESHNVTGTFGLPDIEAGEYAEYRADNTYTILPNGHYDQDISDLSLRGSAVSDGEIHYYYTLSNFSPLTAMGDVSDGMLIYSVLSDDDDDGVLNGECNLILEDLGSGNYNQIVSAEGFTGDPDSLIFLSFKGCVGSSYLTGLNLMEDYFEVSFTVSDTFDLSIDAKPQYEATADGFVQVDEGCGHFSAETVSYSYVGRNSSEAEYAYHSGDDLCPVPVYTDTVFYTGGFTNNNWFLTNVFNWEGEESAPSITVHSVTPGSVSEDTLLDFVSNADLIVLSSGRNTSDTYIENDISTAVKNSILTQSGKNVPIIVYNSLRSYGLNIGALANTLTSGGPGHFVSKNIYCINTELATNAFNDLISGNHENTEDPFYDVWYEIDYENFLRTQNDPDAVTLSETVSIASCVRYIINYGGQRVISKKDSIRVLELQPGEGRYLTASKVSEWTGIAASSITIDTLSTAEFIGKIDDLVEKYDLIYIGSSTTGLNTFDRTTWVDGEYYYAGTTKYTDADMNGLIYTNIGDIYLSGYNLTGLLDRDYGSYYRYDSRVINYSNTSRTFRLSGNDITASKVAELLDYAQAGYPVVVADDLMSGTPGQAAFSFQAELSEYGQKGLKASPIAINETIIPDGVVTSYQWYMKSGTGGIFTPVSTSNVVNSPDDPGTYYYYCDVTITSRGQNYTSTSNTATITVEEEPYSAEAYSPNHNYPSSGEYDGMKDYTVTIARTDSGSSHTYSISVSPGDYSSISYQWYRYTRHWLIWYYWTWDEVGSDSPSYTADNDNRYYCSVKIDGLGWRDSQYAEPSGYEDNNPDMTYSVSTETPFDVGVTYAADGEGVVFTAAWASEISQPPGCSFTWYKVKNGRDPTIANTSYTPHLTSGTYYCQLSVSNSSAYSAYYTITEGETIFGFSFDGIYDTETVPAVKASYTVNPSTVDYCSQTYSFLDDVDAYANVFTETGASTNSNTLIQYLNLSKPEIEFSKDANGTPLYPTKYTGPDGPSLPDNTLSYTFTINNATDVTPTETRYYCNFYIDMNADGRYDYTELLADIKITDSAGNVVRSGELRAGVEYTVTRAMPDEYVGIIPWQLEVVKTAQSRVHASQHGYTHINGTSKTIYILQILHDSGGLDLTANSTYRNLFSQVDDFDLNISTIRAGDLSSVHYGSVTRLNEEGVSETVTYSSLEEYLNTFDMLILGFADTYGELDKTAAEAVVDFINNPAGKAVLFTHDTTSFVNLPFSPYPATDGRTVSTSTWGYYFNTIIRDAVGLDRYGVTNPDYGVTTYSPNKSDLTDDCPEINVADNNSSNSIHGETELSASDISTLLDAGYSIAYEPVSGGTTKTMVSEIQGFTNYNLSRYRDNSDHGTTQTSEVSQVNEGQITTYPFDLNLYGFGNNTNPSDTTMGIANTHEQYYQLNMNPADIVVWYCLADSGYNDSYGDPLNDVVNSYYIYSIGNVTYSGAGHSGNSVTVDEAKLFINTMIAAYRTATTPPEITIVDPDTGDVLTDKFYVGDDTSLLANYGNSLADAAIYFTIADPSLGSGKVITAEFSYDGQADPNAVVPIFVRGGSSSMVNSDPESYTLSGGITYYIIPPDDLLAYIQANGSADLTITITSSLLTSQPASAQITLHALGLFPLE